MALGLSACGESEHDKQQAMIEAKEKAMEKELAAKRREEMKNNPFSAESPLYMQFPPFDKIKNSDYGPALESGNGKVRPKARARCFGFFRDDVGQPQR